MLERGDIATQSWRDNGAIITVETLAQAVVLSDKIAPEHLQVCTKDALDYSGTIPPRGRDFHRRVEPRGDRRLHRRTEPCSAHGGVGSVYIRAVRAELYETHQPVYDDSCGDFCDWRGQGRLWARAEGLQAHAESIAMRLKALNES